MQPNLIDMYSINNDIKKYHFSNNSLLINVLILSFHCVYYVYYLYFKVAIYKRTKKRKYNEYIKLHIRKKQFRN